MNLTLITLDIIIINNNKRAAISHEWHRINTALDTLVCRA